MPQHGLNRSVARATGETVGEIARMGFQIDGPAVTHFGADFGPIGLGRAGVDPAVRGAPQRQAGRRVPPVGRGPRRPLHGRRRLDPAAGFFIPDTLITKQEDAPHAAPDHAAPPDAARVPHGGEETPEPEGPRPRPARPRPRWRGWRNPAHNLRPGRPRRQLIHRGRPPAAGPDPAVRPAGRRRRGQERRRAARRRRRRPPPSSPTGTTAACPAAPAARWRRTSGTGRASSPRPSSARTTTPARASAICSARPAR